jgi:hypothetical protein
MARIALFLLLLMTGLSAVIAGTFLASEPMKGGPLGFRAEWLNGSPFSDYFIPGVVLGALGVGMLGAAYAQLARLPFAPHLSVLCGITLVIWIVVQMTIIPFSVMQAGTLAVAVLMVALALNQLHEAATRARSSKVDVAG